MKRAASFILLFAYAVSFTEVHQALRLPLLVEHYQEHKQQTALSFWEFLVMHYQTDVPHDDTDMRLPFKDCDHAAVGIAVALPGNSLALRPVVVAGQSKPNSYYHSHIPQLRAGEIFQPPKI
jgi:hypothetical protein